MTEIWNLGALCRCCHTDGNFKSLKAPYVHEGQIEIYAVLLRETLGINIDPPPFEASYTICEQCIKQLHQAAHFKRQVLSCEHKFEEYCRNELAVNSELVKVEIDDEAFDNDCHYEGAAENFVGMEDMDSKVHLKLDDHLPSAPKSEDNSQESKHSINKVKKEDNSTEKIEICVDIAPIKNVGKPSTAKKKVTKGAMTKVKPKSKRGPKSSEEFSHLIIIDENAEFGKIYSCKECGGQYDEKDIRKHMRSTHRKPLIKCEYCQKSFHYACMYRKHVNVHDKSNPYHCKICGKIYFNISSLTSHETAHTEKKYTCDICRSTFTYKATLRRHLRIHDGTSKMYMCDACGNSFNDLANFKIHVATVHEKLRPFKCDHCPKTFTAKKHLTEHVRKHTGERPYECDVCSLRFINATYLKRHKEAHSGKSEYSCVVCAKTFNERGKFRSHVRSHSGSLPHKCPLCSKDFSCKYSLRRHIQSHSGVKLFACDLCETRFTQKTQLNRHMHRLHLAAKDAGDKVKCDICKHFVYDLEKHKKAHLDKPHQCSLCEKSYSERNMLNRHIREKHMGVKRLRCSICSKKYVKLSTLRNHQRKAHNIAMKVEDDDNFDSQLTAFAIGKRVENLESIGV